ncbi:succinate-semialdehyde dehydrogenase/glutarate-semialdehyde dehydrogenase [Cryobacterium sp. CAN_C3]|uniref:NAD-dependent succinate-semialdehyde dehydrogenase n=1 Tax=unclassified Cryobacterium TaxID=2649013 RepID=UPI0018CAD254|nr:NAD-dependent succinate-semialdehyde dehydrogenase [Cryobacterium sp. CAN_C3]MEC5154035.1 succinate-semialdehyde dehydrogenase/glutarate-semialdehyde dehydrogenase [Cryobacterium sp. CAN_C3]
MSVLLEGAVAFSVKERSTALLARIPDQLYINGQWQNGTGEPIVVTDPATGRVLKRIQNASAADGARALDAAVAAAVSWAATPARARGEILRRAFDLLQERREDFALLMTLEMGKPIAEANGEVTYGGEFLRWFSEEAVRISGRYGANPEGTGTMVVTHRPVGPCYLITPWNFPLAMATRKIAPALAAGCTVVVKPAELTPLTTLLFVQLLEDAGVPAGVVNVITTTQSQAVSAPIIADPRLRKLSFTGSTVVGRALIAQAAQNVLRTSMELGGNAPFLVFADADIEKAVTGAMLAKFRNTGQACTAANRFIVHASIAEDFSRQLTDRVNALVQGPGTDPRVNLGPLVTDAAVDNIVALVQDALSRGATLLTGGIRPDGPGSFYAPTVLTGVSADSRMVREEIFGPVVGITTFETDEEAIELANDTEYGLIGYIFTNDMTRGHRMIDSIDTGMMGLNTGLVSNAAAPFGGVKQSGLGREGGLEGINEYLSIKYTLIPGY